MSTLKRKMSWAGIVLLAMIALTSGVCKKFVPLSERFEEYGEDSFVVTIPQLAPVKGREGGEIGVAAIDCSVCHSEIYREWSMATHATALADIQYQAELAKESSPKWLCKNCHIPVQNQRQYLVRGDTKIEYLPENLHNIEKIENPDFDPQMQKEGITCATCHVRQDAEGNSYMIGPYGSKLAPHPVKKDRKFLRNICLRCHSPGESGLTSTLACWFNTKDELEHGPVGGEKDCVDCHMPVINRKVAIGNSKLPVREGRQHHWVGGGVPKWYSGYDTLIERGYYPGLSVKLESLSKVEGGFTFDLKYKNDKSGHWLPTGDPERFLLFRAALVDESGNEIKVESMKIGQEWDWGDAKAGKPARRIHDNRLKPLEERTWRSTVVASSPSTKLIITALHVRLKSDNAKYMMATKGINENYLPDGQKLVENAIDHYPFASFIYRIDVDFVSLKKREYSLRELIELSKQEKGRPLDKRVY